jgi:IS30 family transposase
MTYRTRIKYTYAQKHEIWDRWKKGESLTSIGRLFDRPFSSIFNILAPTGGIRPPLRKRSKRALTLSEQEEVSRGAVADLSIRSIAKHLNHPPSTISREIKRNGGYHNYRATQADLSAWELACCPNPCKLACNRSLSRTVTKKLQLNWILEQIAGWIKAESPNDENSHVSHETIYRSLLCKKGACLKKSCNNTLCHSLQSGFPSMLV